MKPIGHIELPEGVVTLTRSGWSIHPNENSTLDPNDVLRHLNMMHRVEDYSPADGRFGIKLLTDAARSLRGKLVMAESEQLEQSVEGDEEVVY